MEPLQVIAAPRRLRILELVWDRELSAGDIAAQFDVSVGRQPASARAEGGRVRGRAPRGD